MAIIQTIDNASQFRDAFHHAGRKDQFSYEALGLLFDHLESLGSDIELDVVAICCEYSEDYPQAIADYYSIDIEGLDEDEAKQHVMNFLCDNTTIVGETSSGTYVYEQF